MTANALTQLVQVLRANPDVGRDSLCFQMERIIVGPLKATHIQTLIIIDALDECKDEEPASAILSVLSRYVDEIPNVKFFIHWGQGVVSWAGTSQVHHKDMDKVPGKNPPGTLQVHSEFSQPVSLQFPWARKWSVHSQCPR